MTLDAPDKHDGSVNTGGLGLSRPPVSLVVHAAALGWIAAMLLFAYRAPDQYAAAMQEDRVVEWWTALLFASAAAVRITLAVRERRVFDGLIGLFCLFVAGEEFSWGQRLLGFTPPVPFLAHNTQQEFNLHNFAEVFGRPKWTLAAALIGFGVVLPAAMFTRWGRALADRLGATAPPLAITPWLIACVALLIVYPVEFTGEWVECLAGFLFLASATLPLVRLWSLVGATLVAAVALTFVSARRAGDDPQGVACARAEIDGLVNGAIADSMTRDQLLQGGSIHKRVWTAAQDGYLELADLRSFQEAGCAGPSGTDAQARRQYAVDPWGTAYWIKTVRAGSDDRRVLIYSFGPNRRRDGDAGETGPSRADDIVAERTVSAP
ncbi:MAG: hypothetical protein ABIV10_11555 [Gemmatimonadaceae bacterium]